jgi:methionine-gamma-lyase
MQTTRRNWIKGMAAAALSPAALAQCSEPEPSTLNSDLPLMAKGFESPEGRSIFSDLIHTGEEPGFSVTPIYNSKLVRGAYQRPPEGNPTLEAFEAKIRLLEGSEAAVSMTCGVAAITQALLAFLRSGDRIVSHRCVYVWITTLFNEYFPQWGIEVKWVDMTDLDQVKQALKEKKTKIVYFEPYPNPSMDLLDAPALIGLAKDAGAMTWVDNTWLTPYLFRPLQHGADLVLHSATKYICGHGSAMGGVVAGSKSRIDKIRRAIGSFGGMMRPFDAFLITQGLKTLPIRMERHCASALKVAKYLEKHPAVERVRYGGLKSYYRRQVCAAYLKGCGGMLGVEWKSDQVHRNFNKGLKMCKNWTSLGDAVTLVQTQGEERQRGVPPRYTRISIGLEDPNDIIADFTQAITKAEA